MNIQQVISIGLLPVSFPATLATGGLKGEAGLAGGILLLVFVVANSVYWSAAYFISKRMPQSQVIKKASILWILLLVGAILYEQSEQKKREAKGHTSPYAKP